MSTSTVQSHATSTHQVMVLETLLLDGLLGERVTGSKQDGGSGRLCQERTRLEHIGVAVRCGLAQICLERSKLRESLQTEHDGG